MSKAEKARKARIAKHKADGTYVPRTPVRGDTRRFVAQESRILRHRESLQEGLEPVDLFTSKPGHSASPHQAAPPNPATPWRPVSPDNVPETF